MSDEEHVDVCGPVPQQKNETKWLHWREKECLVQYRYGSIDKSSRTSLVRNRFAAVSRKLGLCKATDELSLVAGLRVRHVHYRQGRCPLALSPLTRVPIGATQQARPLLVHSRQTAIFAVVEEIVVYP